MTPGAMAAMAFRRRESQLKKAPVLVGQLVVKIPNKLRWHPHLIGSVEGHS